MRANVTVPVGVGLSTSVIVAVTVTGIVGPPSVVWVGVGVSELVQWLEKSAHPLDSMYALQAA